MMTYEERALDIDVIEVPTGHVVTGVRLRKLGGHLNLEIRVTFSVTDSLFFNFWPFTKINKNNSSNNSKV